MGQNIDGHPLYTLTYVAEITTPNLRGILASTSTVAVILGILIQFLLGTFLCWRTVALVSCVMPLASFVLLFFVPESPHWLISKNRLDDAKKSLAWLRGWVDPKAIEGEFKELSDQLSTNKEIKRNKCISLKTLKLYTAKNFLWPFSIVSSTFFLGHFSGMTTLQTYAVKIFSTLKAPIDKYYATIFLGAVEVSGCILSACLVHYVGKRKLNFFSLIGCGCCFMIVAIYAYLSDVKYLETTGAIKSNVTDIENTQIEAHSWIPLAFLIAAAFFSHVGIRILPWMLVGEVYSNETRSAASGFSGAVSYIFGFVSNKTFFFMISMITLPGIFWLYSSVSFIGLTVIFFVLPETEGKTLFQITQHFAGKEELDNKVFRNRIDLNGQINSGYENDEKKIEDVESKL